jgi:hypothetical protein
MDDAKIAVFEMGLANFALNSEFQKYVLSLV